MLQAWRPPFSHSPVVQPDSHLQELVQEEAQADSFTANICYSYPAQSCSSAPCLPCSLLLCMASSSVALEAQSFRNTNPIPAIPSWGRRQRGDGTSMLHLFAHNPVRETPNPPQRPGFLARVKCAQKTSESLACYS